MSDVFLRRGIYGVLDGLSFESLRELGELLIDRSISAVQIRAKSLSLEERQELARLMKSYRARSSSTTVLVVNDDVALASVLELSCHVGQNDMPPALAKRQLPSHALLGLSTHAPEEVERADHDSNVDYMGFGPMYATSSKNDALSPRTIDDARHALMKTKKPLVAIGGLTADNLAPLLDLGFRHFAFLSFLHGSKSEVSRRIDTLEKLLQC